MNTDAVRPLRDQAGTAQDQLSRLWAPWRGAYVAGDDAAEPSAGCPFCVLPGRGPDADRSSLILHRGDAVYVILNAYPYNPGHLMVVPFDHVSDVAELGPDVAAELWRVGLAAIAVLREALRCEGVNVGLNLGAAAGAGIADHVHLHAVPRWVGDTNFVSVVGATRVLPRALQEVYDALAPGFA